MKLLLVRHGEYGAGDHITPDARAKLERLARTVASEISNPDIRTSPITRARETAEVFHTILGGQLTEDPDLTANYLREHAPMTKETARSYLSDIQPLKQHTILVSHIGICGLFLEILDEQFPDLEVLMLRRGEAILFDTENKTTTSSLR